MNTLENSAGQRSNVRGIPFGRYVIRRRLGRGGMGEVFLADQLGPLGPLRPVALKRMLPQLAADQRAARMFLEEMGLAAQLNHPNIATTYDFGEIDGVYFIAMEYVEGLTLSSIESVLGALPVAETMAIAQQIAEALAYAHAEKKPVVHCDISPQNIMISTRGGVKLLDFGIAAMEFALSDRARGKISYAAPEQILGDRPDRRFDIWSLGVSIYEALTGKKPSGAELGEYIRLEKLRPELRDISRVLDRALQLDPQARWPNMRAFSDALLAASKGAPASKEKLALLIERSGGAPSPDEPVEMTATGVAVVMPNAHALSVQPLATTPAAITPALAPPKRPLNLALVAGLAGIVVLGAAALNLFSALEDRAPETAPLVEPPPAPSLRPAVVEQRIAPEETQPEEPLALEKGAREKKAGRKKKERATTPEKTPEKTPILWAPRTAAGLKGDEPGRSSRPAEARPVEIATEANGLGVLSVRTTPWAKVALDGKTLGEGVVAAKPVPAGRHTLVLTPGDDRYAPQTVEIEIRVGVATKVFVDFETGVVRVDPS